MRLAYILAICLVIFAGIELSASCLAPGAADAATAAAPRLDIGIGYLAFGVAALAVALRLGRKLIDRLQDRIDGGRLPSFAAPLAAAPSLRARLAPAAAPSPAVAAYRAKKLHLVSAQ
jgi:hypothetical protein